MSLIKAYAASNAKDSLKPFQIQRSEPGPHDVLIDIHYCGICHSDVHQVRDEWGKGIFPMVPGHEITGVVQAVGSSVTRYKVGDKVNEAYDRMVKGDVRYRFVIDLSTLK